MKINQFIDFLRRLTPDFTPVLTTHLGKDNYTSIDISETNRALRAFDIHSSVDFEDFVNSHLKKNNAKVAYGGYLEKRAIYNRSDHFHKETPETERNIHIGIDLWCNTGTEVLAPLDGVIHSFKDNNQIADYGPTIILEHKIEGVVFYTLYGHLTKDSLQKISVGQIIEKGQVVARLGDASVNGDYAPHLHFQIIKDLQEKQGDYPGVSNKNDIEFYKQNCPDPNLLLKIEPIPGIL